jgi:hypothetical protein
MIGKVKQRVSKFKILSVKLGIGFLVLAIAAVVVARIWCPTASERANAITLEEVQSQAKSYENSKRLAKVGKELAETQFGSAEREEKLNELISLLDPETQTYVKSLPREDRLDAITMKLKEANVAQERKLANLKASEKWCWWR